MHRRSSACGWLDGRFDDVVLGTQGFNLNRDSNADVIYGLGGTTISAAAVRMI